MGKGLLHAKDLFLEDDFPFAYLILEFLFLALDPSWTLFSSALISCSISLSRLFISSPFYPLLCRSLSVLICTVFHELYHTYREKIL
jgi:hypothetical protein